jgi:hypothetical protein
MQEFCVGVYFSGACKHLQIASKVRHNEPQERQASQRYEPLFSDG